MYIYNSGHFAMLNSFPHRRRAQFIKITRISIISHGTLRQLFPFLSFTEYTVAFESHDVKCVWAELKTDGRVWHFGDFHHGLRSYPQRPGCMRLVVNVRRWKEGADPPFFGSPMNSIELCICRYLFDGVSGPA